MNRYPYTDMHEMNLDWILLKVKEMIGEWDTTKNAWNELHEFVDTYFENLDVQQEINNKLDEMAQGGELLDLMKPYVDEKLPLAVADQIADVVALQIGAVVAAQLSDVVADQLPAIAASAAAAEVGDWLTAHIDPDTGYVIDDTLTTVNAAADAKATGDAINVLDRAAVKQNGSYVSDTSTYASYDDLPLGKIFFVGATAGLSNAPKDGTRFLVMTYSYNGGSTTYKGQLALSDQVSYSRIMVNGTWSQWNRSFNYVTTVASDFDNFRESGMYHFADVSGIDHAPASSGGGSLIVFCAAATSGGTGYITQIAQITDRLWHRTLTSGNWTDWEIVVTKDMLKHDAVNLTELSKIEYQYPFYAIRKEGSTVYLGLSNYLFKYDVSNPFDPSRTASVNFTGCIEDGYYTTAEKTIRISGICTNDDYVFCSLRYPTNGLLDMLGADAAGKNFGGLLIIDKASMQIVRMISMPYKCCWVDLKAWGSTELLILTRMHHGFYVYDVSDLIESESDPTPTYAYDRQLESTEWVGPNDNGSYENSIDGMLEFQSAVLWQESSKLYCTFGLYRGGVSTWDFTNALGGSATEVTHYDFNDVPELCSSRTRKDVDGVSHTFDYSDYSTYNATVYKGKIVGAIASAYSSIHGQAGDKSGIVYCDAKDASDAKIASLPLSLIPPNDGVYEGTEVGPTFAVVYHNSAIVNVGPYGLAVFYKDGSDYVFEKNVPLDNNGSVNTFMTLDGNVLLTTAHLTGNVPACNMILAGF